MAKPDSNSILSYSESSSPGCAVNAFRGNILDSDGNALTLCDVMAQEDTIIDDLDRKLKTEKLAQYIRESLTPREALIIRMRYGLDNNKPLTQREVSDLLKISRSYVSRIEKKALLKLRKRYE